MATSLTRAGAYTCENCGESQASDFSRWFCVSCHSWNRNEDPQKDFHSMANESYEKMQQAIKQAMIVARKSWKVNTGGEQSSSGFGADRSLTSKESAGDMTGRPSPTMKAPITQVQAAGSNEMVHRASVALFPLETEGQVANSSEDNIKTSSITTISHRPQKPQLLLDIRHVDIGIHEVEKNIKIDRYNGGIPIWSSLTEEEKVTYLLYAEAKNAMTAWLNPQVWSLSTNEERQEKDSNAVAAAVPGAAMAQNLEPPSKKVKTNAGKSSAENKSERKTTSGISYSRVCWVIRKHFAHSKILVAAYQHHLDLGEDGCSGEYRYRKQKQRTGSAKKIEDAVRRLHQDDLRSAIKALRTCPAYKDLPSFEQQPVARLLLALFQTRFEKYLSDNYQIQSELCINGGGKSIFLASLGISSAKGLTTSAPSVLDQTLEQSSSSDTGSSFMPSRNVDRNLTIDTSAQNEPGADVTEDIPDDGPEQVSTGAEDEAEPEDEEKSSALPVIDPNTFDTNLEKVEEVKINHKEQDENIEAEDIGDIGVEDIEVEGDKKFETEGDGDVQNPAPAATGRKADGSESMAIFGGPASLNLRKIVLTSPTAPPITTEIWADPGSRPRVKLSYGEWQLEIEG